MGARGTPRPALSPPSPARVQANWCTLLRQPWRAWPQERALRTGMLLLACHLSMKALLFFFYYFFLLKRGFFKEKKKKQKESNESRLDRGEGAAKVRMMCRIPGRELGTSSHHTSTTGTGRARQHEERPSPFGINSPFPARKDPKKTQSKTENISPFCWLYQNMLRH